MKKVKCRKVIIGDLPPARRKKRLSDLDDSSYTAAAQLRLTHPGFLQISKFHYLSAMPSPPTIQPRERGQFPWLVSSANWRRSWPQMSAAPSGCHAAASNAATTAHHSRRRSAPRVGRLCSSAKTWE